MTKPVVSIIIFSYNSARHLPALFQSIAAQSYQPIELIVVDNASTDHTVQWIQQQTIVPVQLIINQHNDWFSKGNNLGMQTAQGEYLYICNDDIILTPNYLANLVVQLEQDQTIGMVGGKLLKLLEAKPSTIIDSAGLQLKPWGQIINRGEQTPDLGQFNQAEPIFGITGAGMLLRRTALDKIKHGDHEYFDEDFVAYKEDCDLSWRMHRAGYQVWYQPTAIAYHARSIQHSSLADRRQQASLIRALSYRNHHWVLWKNLSWQDWLKRVPWIFGYECAKLAYVVLFEWSTLAIIPQTLAGIPGIWRKRYEHR